LFGHLARHPHSTGKLTPSSVTQAAMGAVAEGDVSAGPAAGDTATHPNPPPPHPHTPHPHPNPPPPPPRERGAISTRNDAVRSVGKWPEDGSAACEDSDAMYCGSLEHETPAGTRPKLPPLREEARTARTYLCGARGQEGLGEGSTARESCGGRATGYETKRTCRRPFVGSRWPHLDKAREGRAEGIDRRAGVRHQTSSNEIQVG